MFDTKRNAEAISPEGRIYQVEYAMKATALGTISIAISCNEGVIFISERKRVNRLQVPSSITKHFIVYDHIMCGYSGIFGDARVVIAKARKKCIQHLTLYNDNINLQCLLNYLSGLSLAFGESEEHRKIFSRPFGASFMFASGKELFSLNPAGSYAKHKYFATGSGSNTALKEISKKYDSVKTIDNAILLGLRTIATIMEESITSTTCEIGIAYDNRINLLDKNTVDRYILMSSK